MSEEDYITTAFILDTPYATSEEKGTLVSIQDYVYIIRKKNRDLQQKVEQLEKENNKLRELEFLRTKTTLDIINERDEHFAKGIKLEKKLIELENIRKEAIAYINKNWGHWCSNHCKYATETINILNKGSEVRCGKN